MKLNIFSAIVFTFVLIGVSQFDPVNTSMNTEITLFFGRFHPLILHIPIGALVGLFIVEIASVFYPKLKSGYACHVLLWFAIITIIPTIVAGIFLASSGEYENTLLTNHKNLGFITAFISVWLLVLRQWMHKHEKGIVAWVYRVLLAIAILLLSMTGHLGGSLTHGTDYLTKYLPSRYKDMFGIEMSESEKMKEDLQKQIEADLAALNEGTTAEGQALSEAQITKKKEKANEYVHFIQPLMTKYCYDCHGPNKQKAGIRLDGLNWDLINGGDAESWHAVLDQINAGEMPPKGKPRFTDAERKQIVDWITSSLEKAVEVQEVKMSKSRSSLRRLTKSQYTNSLQELLGMNVNFGDPLPEDGKSKMGFSNNSSVLQVSMLHVDYYQKIARKALDKAIVTGDKPKVYKYRVEFGKKIDKAEEGVEFGGFQAINIKKSDFKIDVYDEKGKIVSDENTVRIKKNIGVDMRGSDRNRFKVVENGITMYSAAPHKEEPPKSWQGPSPNLKVLIKNNFPAEGKFVVRVGASRGVKFAKQVNTLLSFSEDRNVCSDKSKSLVFKANQFVKLNNLIVKEGFIQSEDLPKSSKAELSFSIENAGYYQLDFIHPYKGQDDMPSYKIEIDKSSLEQRVNLSEKLKEKSEIASTVGYVFLSKGKHKLRIGGSFFIGLKEISATPLSEQDSYLVKLEEAEKAKSSNEVIPSIRTFIGSRADDGMDYKTFGFPKMVTSKVGDFKYYEFSDYFENLPNPSYDPNAKEKFANILIVGLWNNLLVQDKKDAGSPILVNSLEIEAPYYETWPPKSHTNIFHVSKNQNNKEIYTKEILTKFLTKSFRREPTQFEVNKYMNFWKQVKGDFSTYEEGVKEVLVAILCSPHFIYMSEPQKDESEVEKDNYLLASKMSYFLWNSPPDATLVNLAKTAKLENQIPNQVKRMVNSPKIWQMIRSFTYEWLRIDRHFNMNIDVNKYPSFSRFVKNDMAEETYHFIHHVLKNNLSIDNFIDSKFAMLNQNLAEFYGVDGVKGNDFRPVLLASTSRKRGGLISQGAFLSGHSDGVQAHTVKRAVWLKEKILGETPPPPPPNVPELDPETPGFENLTLKEQLQLHRDKSSCKDCHRKIDPYGVVFENYDAVGRFNTEAKGRPIDVKSQLPDGTTVVGIDGIKDYILTKKKKAFTKALVEYMYAYALGRNVTFADDKEINSIVNLVAKDGYKFQSVVKHIVNCKSFKNN